MSDGESEELDDSAFQILSSSQPAINPETRPRDGNFTTSLTSSNSSHTATSTVTDADNNVSAVSSSSTGSNNSRSPGTQNNGANVPDSSLNSSNTPLQIEIDNEEDADDEGVIKTTHSTGTSIRKRKRTIVDSDANTDSDSEEIEAISIDDLDDDDDDDVIILGSDGETAEATKTTADLLNEKNDSTMNLKQVKCPICLDEVEKCVALPCGHFFCADCVYQAMASSKVSQRAPDTGICALCRKRIKYKDLVWLKFRINKKNKTSEKETT